MNNIKNQLISENDINNIISPYVFIKIKDLGIFQTSFIHKSFKNTLNYCEQTDINSSLLINELEHYERLEFLGDKILDAIITEFLYENYPNKTEGFLTKLKSNLVNKKNLSMLAEVLHLNKFLLISSNEESRNGRNNKRILEDLFESFVGALHKDQGFDIVKKFVNGVYNTHVDINKFINSPNNYKDMLLRKFHENQSWDVPKYHSITYNKDNKHVRFVKINKSLITDSLILKSLVEYHFNIFYNNDYNFNDNLINSDEIIIGCGIAKTKKEAEQFASKECLINLNVEFTL